MLSEIVVRTESELDQSGTRGGMAITAFTGENGQPMRLQSMPTSALPSFEQHSAVVTVQKRNSELEQELVRIRAHLERVEAMLEMILLDRFPQAIVIESEQRIETEPDR
jgi:hypothetical protein